MSEQSPQEQLPHFSTVYIGEDDAINFTDEAGRTGVVTEYGAVYDDDDDVLTDSTAGLSHEEDESTHTGHRNPNRQTISELSEDERLRFDYNRDAVDVYGRRGKVSKTKK